MIDVTHHIAGIDRHVGTRTLEAGEARTLTISRAYDTPPEDLWDACTNPERIARWFLPVSGDFRLGGRYAIEGNASGTIERCEPPNRLDATWEFGGATSWIEVRVSAEAGGARFTLEHIAEVGDDIWAQYGPGAVGVGWDGALLGLTLHLTGDGEPPAPGVIEAWQQSEEGRAFNRLASERWAQASIAAGTDPDEAHAAAARTTAFYTGEPAA